MMDAASEAGEGPPGDHHHVAAAPGQHLQPATEALGVLRRRSPTAGVATVSAGADQHPPAAVASDAASSASSAGATASSSSFSAELPTPAAEQPAGSSASTPSASHCTKSEDPTGAYACNICLETASDPVLTLCGHLYCWPCLHRWLDRSVNNPTCPVCKAATGQEKVIPIYGRGSEATDPRLKPTNIPKRPPGQRPEHPVTELHASGFGAAPADHVERHRYFTVSGGFGWLPLGFMGVQFNFPHPTNEPQTVSFYFFSAWLRITAAHQLFLSRLFLMLGIMVLSVIFLY